MSRARASFSAFEPHTTRSAPASASPCAMPRPMPPLPPVTRMVLPLRSRVMALPAAWSLASGPAADAIDDEVVEAPGLDLERRAILRPQEDAAGERVGAAALDLAIGAANLLAAFGAAGARRRDRRVAEAHEEPPGHRRRHVARHRRHRHGGRGGGREHDQARERWSERASHLYSQPASARGR